MDFYTLPVQKITAETKDAVSIAIGVPAELKDTFKYQQGQYLTVRVMQDGRELRRSYSMSSSPLDDQLVITVKKVVGGRVSTWLCEHLREGDQLEVSRPDGRFFNQLHHDKRRTYYLFAAGSGITPLMSILKTVLEAEPMSTVYLMYGNRNEEQIIFRDALDELSRRYNGQLFVDYILSSPNRQGGGGLFSMFKKSSVNWQGKIGRVDAATSTEFLDEHMPHGPESECFYFVCGPQDMPDTIKGMLLARGIPEKQVYTEHFVNANHVPGDIPDAGTSAAGGGKRVIVHLRGQRVELPVPAGATILDVLVKAKFDPPYSCTAGACSTCMAKVISGKVKMDACYALDTDEIKAGYILTCQAHPETDVVELSYDM